MILPIGTLILAYIIQITVSTTDTANELRKANELKERELAVKTSSQKVIPTATPTPEIKVTETATPVETNIVTKSKFYDINEGLHF